MQAQPFRFEKLRQVVDVGLLDDGPVGDLSGGGRPIIQGRRKKSPVPTWARLCTIFGAVLVMLSGGVLVGLEAVGARLDSAVAEEDLFGDEAAGEALRREPLARIAGRGVHGVDPDVFGIGPVEAANRALRRAGIGWDDVEVLEFGNELDCLTVPLSCGHIVGFDPVEQ